MTSSGVSINSRKGFAMNQPIKISANPAISAKVIVVCTAFCICCFFPAPIKFAITTFAPSEIPTKRLIIMLIIGPLLPTAASAWLPEKRPTTAASAELKSC